MNNISLKKSISFILIVVFAVALSIPLFLNIVTANAQDKNNTTVVSKKDPIIYDFNYKMTQYDYNLYHPDYTQGFNGFLGATLKIADDCLNLNVNGEKVSMKSETDMSLTSSLYPGIKMFLKNSSKSNLIKIYFTTNTDFVFDEQKCVTVEAVPNDDIFREYVFKMSSNMKWQGTINQIQVVFLNAGSNGIINIDRIGFYPDALYSDIDFDFSKGYMGFNGFLGCQSVFTSALTINSTSNKSEFLSADRLNFLASDLSYVRINLQNNSNGDLLKVYFTSNLNNDFSESNSLSINLLKNSNELKSYVLNMASLNGWNGRIKQLKFVLLNAGTGDTISFSSIQIIGGRIVEDTVFDFENNATLWQTKQGLSVSKEVGMKLSITDENAFVSSDTLNIETNNYKFIKLNLQNYTPSSALKVQWITENDKNYDDRKTQTVILEPNSNFKDYVFAVADNSSFEGKIIGLRIMPSPYGKSGNIIIKSIVFTQFSDISFLNRNIREGALSANPGANGWTKNDSGGQINRTDDRTGVPYENNYSFGLNSPGNFAFIVSNEGIGGVSEAYKELPRQENGIIKWSFETGISDSNSRENSISLRNSQTGNAIVEFELSQGKITYGTQEIISNLTSMTKYIFDISINLDTKKMSLAVNSNIIGQSLNLINDEAIDSIYLKTSGQNSVALGYGERIYRVGGFYEDYIGMTVANKPLNTTVNGNSVSVEYIKNPEGQVIYPGVDVSNGIDTKYLKIEKNCSIENDYSTTSNVVDTFVRFAIRSDNTEGSILLSQGTNDVSKVTIENGNVYAYQKNGTKELVWQKVVPYVWYTLKIRTFTELGFADVSVNGIDGKKVFLSNNVNHNKISVAVTVGDGLDIKYLRVMDYLPTTVPYVDSVNNKEGYIGVNAWMNNTTGSSPLMDKIYQKRRLVDKTPYLGFYDDKNKEALDWQIKWMAENGIDFSSFFYINYNDNAIDTYLDLSDYKSKIKFAHTMFPTAAGKEIFSAESFLNKDLPYITERYFKNPDYIKFNNKPVLFVLDIPDKWDKNVTRMANNYLKSQGFDGIELVGMLLGTSIESYSRADFKYITNYWTATDRKRILGFDKQAKGAGLSYISAPGVGADSRIWSTAKKEENAYYGLYITPTQYNNALKVSKELLKTYPTDSLASKMILTENWGEFGEGHSICPSDYFGFNFINQIRNVFVPEADENFKNSTPTALYDGMFPKGWGEQVLKNRSFESGVLSWQKYKSENATLGAINSNEFYYEKGSIKISGRTNSASAIYQDVTSAVLNNGKNALYNISAYLKSSDPNPPPEIDDSERTMSFVSNADKTLALTAKSDKVTFEDYDPNNIIDTQKWIIKKVATNKYQMFSKANGKILKAIYDPSDIDQIPYKKYFVELVDPSGIDKDFSTEDIADDVKWTYINIPANASKFPGVVTLSEISGSVFTPHTGLSRVQKGCEVKFFTDMNFSDQKFSFKGENDPPIYISNGSIALEIEDSVGIHNYKIDGKTIADGSNLIGGQIRVNWSGALKSAKFVIYGDTKYNEDFYADNCYMLYMPENNKSLSFQALAGGTFIPQKDPYSEEKQDDVVIEASSMISEIIKNKNGKVTFVLNTPGIIEAKIFRALKDNNVTATFEYRDLRDKLWYSWTFEGEKINTFIDVNTRIGFTTVYKAAVAKLSVNSKKFYLSFAHKGILPSLTNIAVNVSNKYDDGEICDLYSLNTSTFENKRLKSNLTVSGEVVNFSVDACGEYYLEVPLSSDEFTDMIDSNLYVLNEKVLKDLIEKSDQDLIALRLKKPGILTKNMQTILKEKAKGLKVELEDENQEVYLIWTIPSFDNIYSDIDLGINRVSSNQTKIGKLVANHKFQVVSLRHKGLLPNTKTQVIIPNEKGFAKKKQLNISLYNDEKGKMQTNTATAGISNDEKYIGINITEGYEYVVYSNEKPLSLEKGNSILWIAIVFVGLSIIASAFGTFLLIRTISKQNKNSLVEKVEGDNEK